MAKRKRFAFECGHLGRGEKCHRCAEAARLEAHADEAQLWLEKSSLKKTDPALHAEHLKRQEGERELARRLRGPMRPKGYWKAQAEAEEARKRAEAAVAEAREEAQARRRLGVFFE